MPSPLSIYYQSDGTVILSDQLFIEHIDIAYGIVICRSGEVTSLLGDKGQVNNKPNSCGASTRGDVADQLLCMMALFCGILAEQQSFIPINNHVGQEHGSLDAREVMRGRARARVRVSSLFPPYWERV